MGGRRSHHHSGDNGPELKVSAPAGTKKPDRITVAQDGLSLANGGTYILSFDAYAYSPKTINATVAGKKFKIALTTEIRTFKNKITVRSKDVTSELELLLENAGTTYIDKVRIQEDGLIINGNFASGMAAYEVFAHESAKVDYAVDNLSEKGAFCRNGSKTGEQDWTIQLKQGTITLEKGK
jgi:hypothetical protein